MDMSIFSKEITKMDNRFKGGKPLSDDTAKEYFELLSNIPNQPFIDICKQIRLYSRNYPTPGEIRLAWGDWQKAHPDRIVQNTEKTHCSECDGDGFLEYYKTPKWIEERGLKGEYLYIAKCPFCNNASFAKDIPKLSIEDIEHLGYRLVEKWSLPGSQKEIIRGTEALTEKAFPEQESIPF